MKFYGKVGYVVSEESTTNPGVWEEIETERYYYGDVESRRASWQNQSDSTVGDKKVTNKISILADQFAFEHFSCLRYIEFMGVKWEVTDITVERPRLIISTGGVYNG